MVATPNLLRIVPAEDLSAEQAMSAGRQLYEGMHYKTERTLLKRNLSGVKERHASRAQLVDFGSGAGHITLTGAEVSWLQVEKARTGGDPKLTAFVLYATATDRAVGMASYYDDLPLQLQRLWMPVGASRRLAHTPLVEALPGERNATAWVHETIDTYAGLYAAYKYLRSHSDRPIWTVEPNRSPKDAHHAIAEAGFHLTLVGPLDDNERRGRHFPPHGTLYVANGGKDTDGAVAA